MSRFDRLLFATEKAIIILLFCFSSSQLFKFLHFFLLDLSISRPHKDYEALLSIRFLSIYDLWMSAFKNENRKYVDTGAWLFKSVEFICCGFSFLFLFIWTTFSLIAFRIDSREWKSSSSSWVTVLTSNVSSTTGPSRSWSWWSSSVTLLDPRCPSATGLGRIFVSYNIH